MSLGDGSGLWNLRQEQANWEPDPYCSRAAPVLHLETPSAGNVAMIGNEWVSGKEPCSMQSYEINDSEIHVVSEH